MKKITKSALLISVLISAGVAFSADTFKNSILDMSMKKELNNTVSLTIYTSKPYNENLFITKRNATTYVILFPETDTNLKGEISRSASEGLVQKVDVKTQPYNDQNGKGYTKVVLTTPENTTVLAKTEVYNPDAPVKKVAQTTLPPGIKEIASPEVKQTAAEKPAQVQPKTEQKAEPKKVAEQPKFDIIKPENLPKSDTNKKVSPPSNLPKEEVKQEIVEPEIQQNEPAEKIENDMPLQEADKQELPPPPENVKKAQKSELVLFFESKTFWGSAAGLVLLIMLVLFLNARKQLKEIIGEDGVDIDLEKVKARKQEITESATEEKVDDETESKVNLYRLLNTTEENEEPQEVEEDTYSDNLASLLDIDNVDDTVLENSKEEVFDNISDVAENVNDTQNNDVETEFVLDDIVIDDAEDEKQEEDLFELNSEIQPEEEIELENSIDDYMKYLADNPEKLEVNEAVVHEETEPETIDFEEDVEYSEPEVIPVPEQEEIEEPEIALIDMTNEETRVIEDEQNKLQDIYVDAAANDDEIQNIETIDFEESETDTVPAEFEQTNVNSMFEREDFASDIMQATDIPDDIQLQDYDEASDNEPIFGDENNVLDLTDYKQTVKVHQPADKSDENEEISDEAIVDYVNEHEDEEDNDNSVVLDNGLKVISEVRIKKNAGLYMVDYEGTHALIGFKNDDYYVLKNFEEAPKKELQARLYDKIGRKEQYLVKLGREKMIVEFNQKEIKHVMDL